MASTAKVTEMPEPKTYQIRMHPIEFTPDGKPRDVPLHAAAVSYFKTQFGYEPDFRKYGKAWAVVDLESQTIVGLGGLETVIDCTLFHCPPVEQTKDGLRRAEQVRDLMVGRMMAHLEDTGFIGSQVLIYVSEMAERIWHGFFKRIGATKANRYSLPIQ